MALPLLIVLAQNLSQSTIDFPAPRGIYEADVTTCSEKDRGLYTAIFQGYLSIREKDFEVSILGGEWKKIGNKLLLTTGKFMATDMPKSKAKFSDRTFVSGMTLEIQPSGDLVLQPAKGMYMTSKLTFRRLAPLNTVDALDQVAKVDFESKEFRLTLGWALTNQFFEIKNEVAPQMLEILKSTEPISIRREAAFCLWGVRTDVAVKTVGEMLLAQPTTKDKETVMIRRTLAMTLEQSHHPAAAYFGISAYRKGLIREFEAAHIIGNSANPDGIAFLFEVADKAKGKQLTYVLESMRKLSKSDGLKLARQFENDPDKDVHFEVIRALAETETTTAKRSEASKQLIALFPTVDWMKQCDIAKSLGEANNPVAWQGLRRISGKGSDSAVQQWIDGGLANYRAVKKRKTQK